MLALLFRARGERLEEIARAARGEREPRRISPQAFNLVHGIRVEKVPQRVN